MWVQFISLSSIHYFSTSPSLFAKISEFTQNLVKSFDVPRDTFCCNGDLEEGEKKSEIIKLENEVVVFEKNYEDVKKWKFSFSKDSLLFMSMLNLFFKLI